MTDFEAGLLRRLDGIEARLTAISQTDAERRLLTEIASTTAGTLFTCAELVTHADAIPSLRAALVGALGASEVSRRLGKLLARLEGSSACTIERCGTDANSILWKVCVPKLSLPVEPIEPITDDAPLTVRIANGRTV